MLTLCLLSTKRVSTSVYTTNAQNPLKNPVRRHHCLPLFMDEEIKQQTIEAYSVSNRRWDLSPGSQACVCRLLLPRCLRTLELLESCVASPAAAMSSRAVDSAAVA